MAAGKEKARPKLALERSFRTTVDALWELWTTSAGIESWWGPDGFVVKVRKLDLRPGGELRYRMTATGADQIDYMRKAGMPQSTDHLITFQKVVPKRRLAYLELADFIPGVEPYEVATVVEFEPTAGGSRVVLTFDAMHDDLWTRMATLGRESELEKLARLIES